jgi:dipeptidyl aminopeptidase/acylaminoacyl peptidase
MLQKISGIYVSILRTRFSASSQSMEFNDYWFMMPQQGYIVACVDGRGTGFKGADFKKVTQLELGKYEVEDQIDAAK